jgi:hypothetical protein
MVVVGVLHIVLSSVVGGVVSIVLLIGIAPLAGESKEGE